MMKKIMHRKINTYVGIVTLVIFASIFSCFFFKNINTFKQSSSSNLTASVATNIPDQGITVKANVVINASNEIGMHNRRYEQHASQIHTTKGPLDQQLLRDIQTAYSRGFMRIQNISTEEGSYNFNYDLDFDMTHSMIQDIRAFGAEPIVNFVNMPEWLADTSATDGVYKRTTNPPMDYTKYQKVAYDILSYYKNRYPEIEYIEFWNEPDSKETLVSIDNYHKMYKSVANAMQQINSILPQEVSKLKIGGPTTADYDTKRIQALINYCKTNNLLLDFISWHDYQHSDNPSYFLLEVKQVRGWLNNAGCSNAKTFVTEWQRQALGNTTPSVAMASQMATFAAVGNYYWMLGGLDIGAIFSLGDYVDPNRSLLAPGIWVGKTTLPFTSKDGVPMPTYNVYKMMSMLKNTRIDAISNKLDSNGIGIGTLATKDSSGISVLLWNYQSTTNNNYTVNININNLPSTFNQANFYLDLYLVDETHSNYLYNQSKPELEKIFSTTVFSADSVSTKLNLRANSVALIVLAPGEASSVPTYSE